jgi:hypothetical protein
VNVVACCYKLSEMLIEATRDDRIWALGRVTEQLERLHADDPNNSCWFLFGGGAPIGKAPGLEIVDFL